MSLAIKNFHRIDKNTQAQFAAIQRLRRQRLVEHLHPAPLGHFLKEVEAATGADVTPRLERYARIDPAFVRALGGDRNAPVLQALEGGRS